MTKTLEQLSKKMREIDFAMFTTRAADGTLTSRPMSNNGDVEYTGDSFFFSQDSARKIAEIEQDASVGLAFTGSKGLLGQPPLFIAIEGTAELIRDKAAFEAHWTKDLDYWFKDGIDSPDLVLIKVHAGCMRYWDGEDSGELTLA
jgi:general stress protein 26